jgi:hypothetical protein
MGGLILGVIAGLIVGVIIGRQHVDNQCDRMINNLERMCGDTLYKLQTEQRHAAELRGLLRSLLNKVNRVTSNHLHDGVEVTKQDLDALVDRQHSVEKTMEGLENENV